MELDTPDSSNVNQFTGLQLLRIKRRRGEAPAEQLLVQGGSSSSKRARLGAIHASQPVDHVAAQLSKGLSLEQQASQSEAYAAMTDWDADQQQADTAGNQTIIQRYVRVQTLNKDAFKGLSADEARGLLHTWQQLAAQQNTSTTQSATAASVGAVQSSVHYTVVRSKRPRIGIPDATAQHEPITEQAQANAASSDVLENLCNVIDIHAHGITANGGPSSKRVKSTGQPAGTGPSTQSTPQPQQVDHQPEPSSEVEAALKSIFMPMLEDYLSQMGNGITSVLDARPPPQHESVSEATTASSHHYKLPSRRPKMTTSTTQPPSVHASKPQQQQQYPIAQSSQPHTNEQITAVETRPTAQGGDSSDRKGEEAMDSGDESEQFIYDVYIPVGEAPIELGASNPTNMPIIELPDSDDEMYWAMQEQPGSKPFDWLGHDSEDSNAESYFANSYPDEEDAEEEDEFDMGEYSGRRQASRQAWGEEEFDVNDYDSSVNEDDGLEPVARSRKIAQTLLRNALSKRKEALQ